MATRSESRGISLMELLTVLALIVTLMTLTGPTFVHLSERSQVRRAMDTFRDLFQFARTHAVYSAQPTTVCAIDSDGRCIKSWQGSKDIIVFVDKTKNRRLDSGDELLRSINWPTGKGSIRWRSALGRPYITFLQMGNTWQNGTLYYCPENDDARYAGALVVSQGGRGYEPGDRNEDGIAENRYGDNLSCPL